MGSNRADLRCPRCGTFLFEYEARPDFYLRMPCRGRKCKVSIIVTGFDIEIQEIRPRVDKNPGMRMMTHQV